MQYLLLVYVDPVLLGSLPAGEYDRLMKGCIEHADELQAAGTIVMSQQLEDVACARSLRVREGRAAVVDGPYAETKEVLAGFNLIEAADDAEALRIAHEFPWSRVGCIEVRPVRDFAAVRRRVGA
jgi:hypothetical protein